MSFNSTFVVAVAVALLFAAGSDDVRALPYPPTDSRSVLAATSVPRPAANGCRPGWRTIPDHWGKTIKELCGECRLTKAKKCGKGVIVTLRDSSAASARLGASGYDGFRIENCGSSPKHQDLAPHVIWESIYCDIVPPEPTAAPAVKPTGK